MRIIQKKIKEGIIRMIVDDLDDLWYLSQIVEEGDIVRGRTYRKVKLGADQKKIEKKSYLLSIKVEKSDLQMDNSMLKINGIVVQGPDEIPFGSYHSLNIGPGYDISIKKDRWKKYLIDKVNEAARERKRFIVCLFDREEALFAISKVRGFEILSKIKGEVAKKDERVKAKGDFFKDISDNLSEYYNRFKPESIIIGSPAFFKEDIYSRLPKEIAKISLHTSVSSVSISALGEVLRSDAVNKMMKENRIVIENKLVDELMAKISKDKLVAYGIDYCRDASGSGAVDKILVSSSLMAEMKKRGDFANLEDIMENVEKRKGTVEIISSENEAGKKLDSLGGIAVFLRFGI